MAYPAAAAAAAAAKRQPMFLPGFDRQTQLAMEFTTIPFGTAWLRRTYTNERDPSVLDRLPANEHSHRERRLAEVRYGNNIALLLKACYVLKDLHGSGSWWAAISRIFGVKPDVAESIAGLFVEARALYLSNHSTARDTAPLMTEATQWADKWTSFLNERNHPTPALDQDVFAAVEEFFSREKARNGDLAGVLSKGAAMEPPSAPRALRKRSPSPNSLQWAPNSKRRTISRSTDEPVYDSPPGRTRGQSLGTRSQSANHPEQESGETTSATNGRQYHNGEAHRTSHEEPYFGLRIRGQGERDSRHSPSTQDHHWSEGDEYEALAQSNFELRDRVRSLERERLEASRAQKDRDGAIRTLQARCATFEKFSAAADAQSSVNDRFIREMQEMVKMFGSQTEKLQKMEKQLELSDQAAQTMQSTISSLQKKIAEQARPANEQATATTTETIIGQQEDPATQKRELSEMQVRISSLEAKSVLFNDLHKNVREMKAEIAAQKGKTTTPTVQPANVQNDRDTSTRLRAVEDGAERHGQAVHGMTTRLVALEEQADARNARIASLESRPGFTKDISQLESRVSTVEQKQIHDFKVLDCKLATTQSSLEEMQRGTKELSERIDCVGSLPLIKAVSDGVAEVQTRLTTVEEHGVETSRRLDDMEVSQDALTLHDQSSRIDEISQSLESLKSLLFGLARSDDVEALRAELNALSQRQAAAGKLYSEDAFASATSMIQSLSNRITRLDEMYEEYVTERHNGTAELFHTNGGYVQDGKQNAVSTVIESLCQRVNVMENGFQIMRDAMSGRRR